LGGTIAPGLKISSEALTEKTSKLPKVEIEEPGKVVYIEPYVDAQTGQMMMTVAQTLADGKSVVALDITIDMMRRITTSLGTSDNEKLEMILDDNGLVVVHTDENEIGHNYLEEKNTLGARIAGKLYATGDPFFEMRYGNEEYLVYALAINDQWYSVALIDVGSSYRPLLYITFVTICAVALIVMLLVFIFLTMGTKTLAAERLSRQLSATSDIYVSAHDIDVIRDRYLQLHADSYVTGFIPEGQKNAQNTLIEVMKQTTAPESLEEILAFIDLSTLQERLGDSNTITVEFHGATGRWCRGRFVVSEYMPDGKISHVLWLVENIDKEKKRRDELQDLSARAIAQSEAKSAFLARMSHEIRTPINAIMGMNEMVLRETGEENIAGYAETIRSSGLDLIHMVDDILSYSRKEEGEMELISEDYEESIRDNDGTVRNYRAGIQAPDADILAVDDTQVNLMVAKSLLKRTGVRVDTATSGEEGLTLAARKKYDLILLDHMMPGKDGIEVLKDLRNGDGPNAQTPVVCLTANAIAGAREKYLAEGFDDYLSKPINPDALEGMLTKYLPADKIKVCDESPEEQEIRDGDIARYQGLEGIDTEQGIHFCGSVSAYILVVQAYYDAIEGQAAGLEDAYARAAWDEYTIMVHSL
ncbi:MAG: type III pantothenate kinase, partial [Lachnospiraceae bacterium]|nr:type III pantothenate kinase [Lachnospiraceae bacterium]